MIILDTHIWIWWVHNDNRLPAKLRTVIKENEKGCIGVSVFSCWEIAKLVELKRLSLHCSTQKWIDTALHYPGIQLIELTPKIVIESTQLPGEFHRDPADQIIVATARIHNCPLLTIDEKIISYPFVKLLQ